MNRFLFFALLSGILFRAEGQTVTWSEHIAPIIYKHCTGCHRPGEIAPFSLTSYQDAANWAYTIKYVTNIRYMPPWKADTKFGREYVGENFLTDDQVDLIKNWVDGGMLRGDSTLEPPVPQFPSGSQIGTPDLVLSFAKTHIHPGDGEDEYRYFVIPTGLMEDKDLVALEMRPGNTRVVHHALFWEDLSGSAAAADAATPEYGYIGNGGVGTPGGQQNFNNQFPGYVPGQRPYLFSQGIAQKIHAGSDLVIQVHYAPTTADEPDSSTVNLFFASQPAARFVKTKIMLPFAGTLENGPFIIPANQTRLFHGTWKIPEHASLLSISPHMHLLGTNWEVFAVTPSGDTINLINIPDWDFNWQGTYPFKKLIPVPANTVIHAFAGYDNTVNNPNNPNNPPKLTAWGEGTSDEMYYLPISYLSYQQGDENIEFTDGTSSADGPNFVFQKNKLYPVWPNPASGQVKIGYTIGQSAKVNLHVFDARGTLVASLLNNRLAFTGEHIQDWDVTGLLPGLYFIRLDIGTERFVQKLIVGW